MSVTNNVILNNARPDDRVHLLLWDNPSHNDIISISLKNNALCTNYRENLLQRINKDDRFLALQHNLDSELAAIRFMCVGIKEQVVLLENLDCLITYLQVQSGSNISLFWSNLEKTRKLEKLLWIILPIQLAPSTWPKERIKIVHNS
jgi:hypothetical protein